jgi:pSer/pThr/pTyr-binding forkhead associated (FHA) protein
MRTGEPFLDEFLDGCGCPGSLALQLEGIDGNEIDRLILPQPFALVGRHPQNDVILDDPEVSSRHTYLQVIAGGVFCLDLKSRTGTHWPEGPRPFGWINPHQFLRLGKQILRLLEPCKPGIFDPMVAGSLKQPLLTLEFSHGRTTRSEWSMNRVLALIGTAAQCKVRLHDGKGVAPFHASLVCTPKGTWVVDLLGPAGVYHNGQKVRCARLEDGDSLSIADFEMHVRCQPAMAFALQLTSSPQLPEQSFGNASNGDSPQENLLRPFAHAPQSLVVGQDNPGKALLEAVLLPLVQQFSLMQNQMFEQFREAMVMMFQMFGSLQKDQMEFIRQELGGIQDLSEEIQTLQAELKKHQPSPQGQANTEGVKTPSTPENSPPGSVGWDARSPATSSPAGTEKIIEGKTGPEVHAWLSRRMAEIQEDRQGRLQKILNFLSGK